MQQPEVEGSGHLPSAQALPEDLTPISGCRKMYWGNHVRILFTVTLVWQAVHLEKSPEKEERKEVVKGLNATVQKQQPKNEATFTNALNDINQSYESRKQQSSRSLVPFTGITESKKLNRRCCQNGGTCILGTFCACLKHFTGRYCEYDERLGNCGSIPHGVWVLKDCWLCRCGYGTLHCLSEIRQSNCGYSKQCFQSLVFSPSSGVLLAGSCETGQGEILRVDGTLTMNHTFLLRATEDSSTCMLEAD